MTNILLTLLSSNALNAVYGTFGIGMLIVLIVSPIKRGTIQLNALRTTQFWLLFFFGITYTIVGVPTIQGILYYLVVPLIAFVSGWSNCEVVTAPRDKVLKNIIYSIAVGFAIHAALNYTINYGRVRWELVDFFSGRIRAATGSGSINTIAFSLIPCILFIEKDKKLKWLGCIFAGISIAYAFLLGTRTQFLILAIVLMVVFPLYMQEKRGNNGAFLAIIALSCIALFGFIAYHFDLLNIKTYIDESNLMARYDAMDAVTAADQNRLQKQWMGLINMFMYPFGGVEIEGHYHNMWLDIGRVGGIIPAELMIWYSVTTCLHAWRLSRCKLFEISARYAILAVSMGIILNFAVEPVVEGIPEFWYISIVLNGAIEQVYNTSNVG